MATRPQTLQMAWFFPVGSVSTSLAWLYEYNCDWEVFFSFSGTLKSFGGKRAEYFTNLSISQTVIGQPRSLTPIPWNTESFTNADAHLHSPIIQACRFFKQPATDCERGKIVSPLHTSCITQILSPLRARHYFYVNLNTHFTYIIIRTNFQLSILTYTNPLNSLLLM